MLLLFCIEEFVDFEFQVNEWNFEFSKDRLGLYYPFS